MKVSAQRHFCQPDTEALHPILEWKLKIVVRCLRISFLEGQDGYQGCLKLVLPALWTVERKGIFLGASVTDWSIHPESSQAGKKEYMQLDTDQTSEPAAAQYLLCVITPNSACISRWDSLGWCIVTYHSNLVQVWPVPLESRQTYLEMVLYKSILSPTKASGSLVQETYSCGRWSRYSCGRWSRSSAEVVSCVLSRKDVLLDYSIFRERKRKAQEITQAALTVQLYSRPWGGAEQQKKQITPLEFILYPPPAWNGALSGWLFS